MLTEHAYGIDCHNGEGFGVNNALTIASGRNVRLIQQAEVSLSLATMTHMKGYRGFFARTLTRAAPGRVARTELVSSGGSERRPVPDGLVGELERDVPWCWTMMSLRL